MTMTRILCAAVCAAMLAQSCFSQSRTKVPKTPAAVFQAYVAAWNHHDYAALDSLLAPDSLHEDFADGIAARGPAADKKFMQDEVAAMPDFEWRITNLITSGNTVAAEWTWTATYTGDSPIGPVKNFHVAGRGASVAIIEKGRIKRESDYYDNASYFPKPVPPAK